MKQTLSNVRNAVLVPYHWMQGFLAANHYDYPASAMTVIGVTGTNGKSIFLPCTVYIEVEGSELFRTSYASGLINEHWDVESMLLIGNVTSVGISGGTQQELELLNEAFIRPVCD